VLTPLLTLAKISTPAFEVAFIYFFDEAMYISSNPFLVRIVSPLNTLVAILGAAILGMAENKKF
jgi:hypothetical protein